MIRVALLSNVKSHRVRRLLDSVQAVARCYPPIRHARFEDFAALRDLLRDAAQHPTDVLAVLGGDGTVQGVLTELLTNNPFPEVPPILVLSGGMTNMTARDVGPQGRPADALDRLMRQAGGRETLAGFTVRRHVLRVASPQGSPVQYGMYFGTAAVVRAIQLCHSNVHSIGLEAGCANAATLAGTVFEWIFRRRTSTLFKGDPITLSVPGEPAWSGQRLVVSITTLDRLVLGARPFWNDEDGPVRMTVVDYPPQRFLSAIPRVLYGWPDRHLPAATYHSRGVSGVSLQMTCPFTVDGQLFETDPAVPLDISDGGVVRFIKV
jgi:hypothetical protein